MIKKVKGLVAVIAVLASVLVFAGCGNSTGSDGLPSNMGNEYVGEANRNSSVESDNFEVDFNHEKSELKITHNGYSENAKYEVKSEDDLDKAIRKKITHYDSKLSDKLDGKEIFYLEATDQSKENEVTYWELGVNKDGKQIELIPLSEDLDEIEIQANLAN